MTQATATVPAFTNYADLLQATQEHQLTAQEIINGRSMINGKWQAFEISSELKQQFAAEISSALGGRETTKGVIKNLLIYGKPQHWGLARLVLINHGKRIGWYYIDGQDASYELRIIRNELKAK